MLSIFALLSAFHISHISIGNIFNAFARFAIDEHRMISQTTLEIVQIHFHIDIAMFRP